MMHYVAMHLSILTFKTSNCVHNPLAFLLDILPSVQCIYVYLLLYRFVCCTWFGYVFTSSVVLLGCSENLLFRSAQDYQVISTCIRDIKTNSVFIDDFLYLLEMMSRSEENKIAISIKEKIE